MITDGLLLGQQSAVNLTGLLSNAALSLISTTFVVKSNSTSTETIMLNNSQYYSKSFLIPELTGIVCLCIRLDTASCYLRSQY